MVGEFRRKVVFRAVNSILMDRGRNERNYFRGKYSCLSNSISIVNNFFFFLSKEEENRAKLFSTIFKVSKKERKKDLRW